MKLQHQKILQQVQSTYESIGEEFAQTRAQQFKDLKVLLPYIQEELKKRTHASIYPPTHSLLDLGCGNGRLAGFLSRNLQDKSINYIGMDVSKALLAIAQKQYPAQKFIEGGFLDIPLENKSVDIICSLRAFHHLPSQALQAKALQEIHRVLKPGGLLIMTVWNLWQPQFRKHRFKSLGRAIVSLGKWEKQGLMIPWGKKATRYYYAFKPKQLKKLIETNNYGVVELAGIDKDQRVEVDRGSDILLVAKS